MRRYRKGAIDRLYVEDAEGLTYGWADAATGETTIQIPGSEARVEAAFTAWALSYPADDLATHIPGHSKKALAAAWQAEVEALDEDARTLDDMRQLAIYQRDQYLKGNTGELRIGMRLNELHKRGWGVLHAIPLYDGRADIDHLLVGSGGVWTVNSKSHGSLPVKVTRDRMTVGRTYVDHIPAARHEASVVSRILRSLGIKVPVHPAVALDLSPHTEFHVVAEPEDVIVDQTSYVVEAIERSEGLVDQPTINAVFALLRQRTTWESST
ncbi:MAG: NERD domain-containing protein [Demequina sp.]|nr:NERD domain-containing protein [Demequina sp.]